MKKRSSFILFGLILLFFSFAPPCTAKQMAVLVHPFENTGDKEYAWISAGMTDSVITDLMRIRDISVISNQDRKKALDEMQFILSGLAAEDKMVKLGKLTGANIIFAGSYLVSGNRLRVYARLVNAETGKVESTAKIDGTLTAIFDLQDKVVLSLMGETEKVTVADIKPVSLTEQDRKSIAEKPRASITAYEWRAKGLQARDTNPKEALDNFKKALEIDPNYTDALINAGTAAGGTLNLFSEALGYLDKADRIFRERNETKSAPYAALMMDIGSVYGNKGQLDRALEYFRNSQSIRDELGLQNTAGYAGLMTNIGIVYYNKGQLDRALEYYLKDKSIEDSLGLQNTGGYAALISNIGNVYGSRGQLDRAMEYYLNSQFIRERLGLQNTAGYAGLMMNIGSVYGSKDQVDRALEYFLNSQSIRDRLGLQNTAGYAGLLNNIGNTYYSKGDLDRALEYYMKNKSIWDNLGLQNIAGYAALMNNIGNVYGDKGQVDRALEYYVNSQSMRDRLGLQNTTGYAGLMMNMASSYEKQGQRETAGKYFRMAYDAYVKSGYDGEWKERALTNAKRLGY